jgi:hypothetical protein
MRSRLLSLALTLPILALVVGPSAAAGPFIPRESAHWTWEAPKGWHAIFKSETVLWLAGPSVPGGNQAFVERSTVDLQCASGASWEIRVRRFFRDYRQHLRASGFRILSATDVSDPQSDDAKLRRQTLRLRDGSGLGTETIDYTLVGMQDGMLLCHRWTRYREIDRHAHTREGIARIKRVLASIRHK